MKKIYQYIEELYQQREFYVVTGDMVVDMNNDINNFIKKTYPKIEFDDYISLEFDPTFGELHIKIKKELEDQLKLHYPETLI